MDIVTLTGRYVLADGSTPATGVVTITLSTPLHDATGNVIATTKEITKPLIDGAFAVALVATTSPGITPSGATYRIVERLGANGTRTYSIELPHDAQGATADLADLAPVQDSTITYGVTLAAFDAHKALTTDVHGIADTSVLETITGAQSKADAAQAAAITTAATDATTKADAAQAAAESTAATALSSHNAATQNVHGLPDIGFLNRFPAYLIAASDSSTADKAMADVVCDGVDDEVEINAAASIYGRVALAPGTFRPRPPITIGRSNTTLSGSGPGTIIDVPSSAVVTGAIITAPGTTNVTIRDLVIQGTTADDTLKLGGIALRNLTNFRLQNVRISNTPDDAIWIAPDCDDIVIDNCVIENVGNNRSDIIRAGLEIDGNPVFGTIPPKNVKLLGCTFRGCKGPGIAASSNGPLSAENVIIGDCLIEGNNGYGIESSKAAGTAPGVSNLIVRNNIVRNNGVAKTQSGIRLFAKHARVHDNIVADSGLIGIDIAEASDDIQVHNNSCYDTRSGASRTQQVGIRLINTPSNVVVRDNYVFNNTGNDYRNDSTGGSNQRVSGFVGEWVSENSGLATIPEGATSVVVNHGLSATPEAFSMSIVPITTGVGQWWVKPRDSTSFTLNIPSAAPTGGAQFGWRAALYRY